MQTKRKFEETRTARRMLQATTCCQLWNHRSLLRTLATASCCAEGPPFCKSFQAHHIMAGCASQRRW